MPASMGSPMGSGSRTSHTDLQAKDTLSSRQSLVNKLTKRYYQGDIIPISTKSQILRAQKFSVFYHYFMTVVVFLYGFFIPLTIEDEEYGGLDPRDWHGSEADLYFIGIMVALPLVRLGVMSWSSQFYQLILLLVSFEILIVVFVCVWWSHGLPALASIFLSNLLNVAVSQAFWQKVFAKTVEEFKEITPPNGNDYHHPDTTSVAIWPGFANLQKEWFKLMGFKKAKTLAQFYDERCGVFAQKQEGMSHSRAMLTAYNQSLVPSSRIAPWTHLAFELWSLNYAGLLDGMLTVFISNAVYAFAGIWLGKATFVNWFHGGYALISASILVLLFFFSVYRTMSWLQEGLGVAVAEKEWLAHDIVKHTGEREEMIYDVLDMVKGDSPESLADMGQHEVHLQPVTDADLAFENRGHLNLVYMWLCTASVADFIGESYLAKMYWNLALQSRYMVEAITYFEFRLYHDSKYEVMHKGTLIRITETFMLTVMSCLYFGSFFPQGWVPVPLMAFIGAACFISSILKLMEAVQFVFSILSAGKPTQRATYVSEWIVLVAVIFVLINVGIWLYLLPIMKGWDLPVGKCEAYLNQVVFPTACQAFIK